MSKLNIFVPINKIDEEQRLVYGQVAAEVLDNSGEMFDYEGSKPYFQKWSDNAHATSGGKSKGNLRVMHTSKVAGIVTDLGFDDDNRTIDACTKVVDDAEWAMVLAGGYTGFSMGGRYVSRAEKSDGIKTYIADPVEISLVDKPCIPTATFSVVKADGIVEEHRFRDDLYQKADTGGTMYVPTNDEMLPVAQGLAKAAGKTGPNDWLDFMDQARTDIVAKHDGGQQVSEEAPAVDTPAQPDAPTEDAAKADNPFLAEGEQDAGTEGGEDDDAKAKAKKEGEGEDGAAEEDDENEEEAAAKADAASAPELEQGWKAKDGSFHLKKSDALAHNASLDATPVEPGVADKLAALVGKADAIISGEVEQPAAEAPVVLKAADVLAVIEEPIAKFKAFRESECLAKGMYSVERLACILDSLDSLHCSLVGWWDSPEVEHSAVAGSILEHMKGLGANLVTLATEEVQEILARSGKRMGTEMALAYDDGIMELAASTLGLEKSALTDNLAKRAPVEDVDTLAKVAGLEKTASDALAKAEAAEGELAKVTPLVEALTKRLDQMAAMPRPKAPMMVIGKGDDVGVAGGGAAAPAMPFDLEKMAKENPELVIKAAILASQQNGQRISLPAGQPL